MTPRPPVPAVLPLGGGRVLLSGAAVIDAARAVRAVIRTSHRRDSVRAPARLLILVDALEAEAAQVVARTRQSDVAAASDPADSESLGRCEVSSGDGGLTTRAAAAAMGVSMRTVQRNAKAWGSRKVAGRWALDPAAVADRTTERS